MSNPETVVTVVRVLFPLYSDILSIFFLWVSSEDIDVFFISSVLISLFWMPSNLSLDSSSEFNVSIGAPSITFWTFSICSNVCKIFNFESLSLLRLYLY